MNVGDRVVLACAPWPGAVTKVHSTGRVDVALDDGGKAMGMAPEDVKPEETDAERAEREERERKDRAWPPKSMETKVPRPTGQK